MGNREILALYNKTALGKPFKIKGSTLNSYNNYIKYLLAETNKNALKITEFDITDFMLKYQSSDSYYNGILSGLKSFYKILMYLRLTTIDPTIGLISIRKPVKKERLPLSRMEEKQILKGVKNVRDRAIITTLLRCGLRIAELVSITLEQYENRTDNDMIMLTITKGDKPRELFLNSEVIEAIENYLPNRKSGCDRLFVSNQGTPIERTSCSRTLKVCARRGGVNENRIKDISNHVLRHSSITDKIDNNVPIEIVAEIHGHSNINTTMGYYKKDLDRVRLAMG